MRNSLLFRKSWLLSIFFILPAVGFAQFTQEWVARFNGPGNSFDESKSIVVDEEGNVYVTGSSTGAGTGRDYSTIKYNAAGIIQWEARYNGPGNSEDGARSIGVDRKGNVYVTGSSTGNGTSFDFATIKYNSAGVEQWVARYNGPGNNVDEGVSIKVDHMGNVYVIGRSIGLGTFIDYTTIKYNKKGIEQWVARYDGPGESDLVNALTLDEKGNVYVTGGSNLGVDLDGEDFDFTTIKYNRKGQELWVKRFDGSTPGNIGDHGMAIVLDKAGNIYVTGSSARGGGEHDSEYATVKYDANGNEQWVATYNGPTEGIDVPVSLAVDPWNNAYVTGMSASVAEEENFDYATIRYDVNGNEVWARRFNGPGNDHDKAASLALDGGGNVYVTGQSTGLGTGTDFATIKYNAAGVEQWVARYNGPANDADGINASPFSANSHTIAVDGLDNVYVTGFSTGIGSGFDYTTIKYSQPAVFARISQPTVTQNELPSGFRITIIPNPAATTTKIFYDLPFDGRVSIVVFDMLGRKITTLVDAGKLAGKHVTDFNITTVPKGLYFYRITVKTAKEMWSETGKLNVIM